MPLSTLITQSSTGTIRVWNGDVMLGAIVPGNVAVDHTYYPTRAEIEAEMKKAEEAEESSKFDLEGLDKLI